MTRTYALKRLLEHGRMTRHEIVECTGWRARQVDRALAHLKAQRLIVVLSRDGNRGDGLAFEAVKS